MNTNDTAEDTWNATLVQIDEQGGFARLSPILAHRAYDEMIAAVREDPSGHPHIDDSELSLLATAAGKSRADILADVAPVIHGVPAPTIKAGICTLDALRQSAQARHETIVAAYEELIDAMATGRPTGLSDEAAGELIGSAGKSMDDAKEDVLAAMREAGKREVTRIFEEKRRELLHAEWGHAGEWSPDSDLESESNDNDYA